jgi:FkbM family methyltransferase
MSLSHLILKSPLGYKAKKSLLKRVAPDLVSNHDFVAPFYGLRYRGNTSNAIDLQVFLRGAYEKFLLQFLHDWIERRGIAGQAIALDIGANVGHHTLFLSTVCSWVHSFEPYPPVLTRLQQQVVENHLHNVTVHSYGLGDQEQILTFYAPPSGNLGTGSFVAEHNAETVPVGALVIRQGDIAIESLGLSRLDLIKIDVEGFEPQVLQGLQKTLAKYRPLVVFELGDTAASRIGGIERQSWLPQGYQLQTFAKVNRDTGAYSLCPYIWGQDVPTELVLAVPT